MSTIDDSETGPFSGLITTANNMLIIGDCYDNSVTVRVYSDNQLQASGTETQNGTVQPVDINASPNTVTQITAAGTSTAPVDIDVIARAKPADLFTRLDLHGEVTGSSCTFWGTLTPSS